MKHRDRLNGIFQDIFDDTSLQIQETTTAADIEDWDSLSNINLIVAIENEFKIKIALGEVRLLKNVGEMLQMIDRKVGP